jgi:hypothetical protein
MPKKRKKKTKKNPADVNLLARSVVEAAVGESLTPRNQRSRKPQMRIISKSKIIILSVPQLFR